MIEVNIRFDPEAFADAFWEDAKGYDAPVSVDPAFWQGKPEGETDQDDSEKPF